MREHLQKSTSIFGRFYHRALPHPIIMSVCNHSRESHRISDYLYLTHMQHNWKKMYKHIWRNMCIYNIGAEIYMIKNIWITGQRVKSNRLRKVLNTQFVITEFVSFCSCFYRHILFNMVNKPAKQAFFWFPLWFPQWDNGAGCYYASDHQAALFCRNWPGLTHAQKQHRACKLSVL